MKTPREIAMDALRSAEELRLHNRKPVRIRMHPEDIRDIRESLWPDVKRAIPVDGGALLWGFPLEPDETTRRGEPVAEMESNRDKP